MVKKYILPSIIVIIVIVFLGIDLILNKTEGINVKLINNAESTITGLDITYTDLKEPIKVPDIESKESYATKIEIGELEDEGCMELYYVDKLGNEERIIIVGYIETGYRGKVEVNINSIDTNGKLDVRVNEEIDIF